MLKSCCCSVLKSADVISTSYLPGAIARNAYWPFESVVCVCSPAGPRNCIVARGMRAPDGSVMTPRRDAWGEVCASAEQANAMDRFARKRMAATVLPRIVIAGLSVVKDINGAERLLKSQHAQTTTITGPKYERAASAGCCSRHSNQQVGVDDQQNCRHFIGF